MVGVVKIGICNIVCGGCGQDISGIVQSEAMVTVRTTQREGIPLLGKCNLLVYLVPTTCYYGRK